MDQQDQDSSTDPDSALPPPSWGSDQGSSSIASSFEANRTQLFDSPPRPRSSVSVGSQRPLSYSGPGPCFSGNIPSTSATVGEATRPQYSSRALRVTRFEDGAIGESSAGQPTMPRVEKDVDDPNTPLDRRAVLGDRQESTTITTLNRLFAVQSSGSPDASRASSFQNRPIGPNYTRSIARDTAPLPRHLYTKGLLEGRHSDITVIAFDHSYRLHRLILDRAPFFSTALSEPWLESAAKEITLHPEDVDVNITQPAFELALKRLYGSNDTLEEDAEALALFATGCWLEMPDLIEASIESLLRQLGPETLASTIKLMTMNYYGKAGERILASAKAMLCAEGSEMPLKYWDGISGEIVREIVGNDGLFVENEWERWVLAKRLLDRRLKARAIEAGLITRHGPKVKAPDTLSMMAVRFDTVYRKNHIMAYSGIPDSHHRWVALYTHPDIEPLLVLLDEGIHYVHLEFEQLQFIRRQKDVLGLPVMPEKVINDSFWMGMELRQRILNSRDHEEELGLSVAAPEPEADRQRRPPTPEIDASGMSMKGKAKEKVTHEPFFDAEEEMESGSWDGNGKPRKFWIPSTDCNIVMGGNADPVVTVSAAAQRASSRLSATIQPEDAQWATDFAAASSDRPSTPARQRGATHGVEDPQPIAYSHIPPFRFAVEFPHPRLLKKKRMYSRTVFYAGSLWNIYIQRVRSSKNPQLGVYLHRAKERENEENLPVGQSVDERIGQLERELLMRTERRAVSQQAGTEPQDDTSSGGDPESGLLSSSTPSTSFLHQNFTHSRERRASANDVRPRANGWSSTDTIRPAHEQQVSDNEDDGLALQSYKFAMKNLRPTLPPYVDGRPTIKTYFKIYSPSKGGRMLSLYESAPDQFNFSQSWGWRSSTLMLDEGGLLGVGVDERENPPMEKPKKDARLRFMIVLGNV